MNDQLQPGERTCLNLPYDFGFEILETRRIQQESDAK